MSDTMNLDFINRILSLQAAEDGTSVAPVATPLRRGVTPEQVAAEVAASQTQAPAPVEPAAVTPVGGNPAIGNALLAMAQPSPSPVGAAGTGIPGQPGPETLATPEQPGFFDQWGATMEENPDLQMALLQAGLGIAAGQGIPAIQRAVGGYQQATRQRRLDERAEAREAKEDERWERAFGFKKEQAEKTAEKEAGVAARAEKGLELQEEGLDLRKQQLVLDQALKEEKTKLDALNKEDAAFNRTYTQASKTAKILATTTDNLGGTSIDTGKYLNALNRDLEAQGLKGNYGAMTRDDLKTATTTAETLAGTVDLSRISHDNIGNPAFWEQQLSGAIDNWYAYSPRQRAAIAGKVVGSVTNRLDAQNTATKLEQAEATTPANAGTTTPATQVTGVNPYLTGQWR